MDNNFQFSIFNFQFTVLVAVLISIMSAFVIVDITNAAERRGVMGCNAAGFGSVGSRTPSGAHVPVWDYAVSFNTNILIYKECILDAVQNAFSHGATSALLKNGLNTVNTGFNGNPQFVTHEPTHYRENVLNPRAQPIYAGAETDNLCAPFKQEIRTSLQKNYEQKINRPNEVFSCSVEASRMEACLRNDLAGCGGLAGYLQFVSDTNNNSLFAYYRAQSYMDSALRAEVQLEKSRIDRARGFLDKTEEQTITLADGSTVTVNRVVTPGFLIAQYASDLLGSGLRQMENADEIDEIIGLLMSNVGTQMVSSPRGLAGMEPYLTSMVDEAYNDGRDRLVTLTLNSLTAAIENESTIQASLESAASAIIQAKSAIRSTDLACLDKVVAEAEESTRLSLCWSSMGTTTNCGVTKSREYDYGRVETFESARQRVSMSGYARSSGNISTRYQGGGMVEGSSDTSAGGQYNKYTSIGQDLSELSDGTINPYATESTYTTLGDFSFSKTTSNNEAAYRFSYDLPDVTVIATSPTSSIPVSRVLLDLKKNHSELVIETENTGKVGYATLSAVYSHIGRVKATIDQLQTAKTNLQKERSAAAVNAAETVLDKSRTDSAAFTFAEEMKGKVGAIQALSEQTRSCWQDGDGSGCGSARWCTDASVEANWSSYIR